MKPLLIAASIASAMIAVSACASKAPSVAKPAELVWEASAAEIAASLEGKCANGLVTRPIEPPFLPNVQDRQVQIDCDGLDFFGAARWAEFVIGDDRLQMAWVMVEESDKEAIIAAMRAAYDEPPAVSAEFIAFESALTAWRHEPPEVLFYAPSLAPWVENLFAEQAE